MNTIQYLLFTKNLPLARLEVLLLDGSVEEVISNQVMWVCLPASVDVNDLCHTNTQRPNDLSNVSIRALQDWIKKADWSKLA